MIALTRREAKVFIASPCRTGVETHTLAVSARRLASVSRRGGRLKILKRRTATFTPAIKHDRRLPEKSLARNSRHKATGVLQ